MKIETPQILWHNGSEGNGKPAPLYSVSLLPNALPSPAQTSSTPSIGISNDNDIEILATAGNSNEIHVWKLQLSATHMKKDEPAENKKSKKVKESESEPPLKKHKIFSVGSPNINHITTLSRHERSINAVSFSPHGTHLASAGDGGTLMVHSIPSAYRYQSTTASNSKNPSVFWKTQLQSEKDLTIKLVHTGAEDVMDISWCNDERKFMIGTLDHAVLVFEEDFEKNAHSSEIITKKWNCVWKNTKEHTHYVQGVSFDPLGVYLSSQGSDRSVRVWQRKGPKGMMVGGQKKKVLMDKNATAVVGNTNANADTNANTNGNANANAGSGALSNGNAPSSADVERHLQGKFDVLKAKVLKYRVTNAEEQEETTAANTNANANATASKKHNLFADESTVESFFRRLSWTTDGAFLITPASLWYPKDDPEEETVNASSPSTSFATYLFARHQFDRPYKVLHGLEKPSVVIRPNPVLFQLPAQIQLESKENMDSLQSSPSSVASGPVRRSDSVLPYRSIFAVLTVDSILIYDTYHSSPLCIARGLHYAGLTDCSWSSDGHSLVVSSTDGYISMISFENGELGEVYVDPCKAEHESNTSNDLQINNVKADDSLLEEKSTSVKHSSHSPSEVTLPPCDPGQSATIVAPPTKRARTMVNTLEVRKKPQKKRIAPVLVSCTEGNNDIVDLTNDESCDGVDNSVVGGVTNLSLTSAGAPQ